MLGQILIKDGVISAGQLEQALAQQRTSGALLGDILLSQNFITEEALARALAREAGVPFVSIDGIAPDPNAVALVPEEFARHTSSLGGFGTLRSRSQANLSMSSRSTSWSGWPSGRSKSPAARRRTYAT